MKMTRKNHGKQGLRELLLNTTKGTETYILMVVHVSDSEAESGQNPTRRCSFVNYRPNLGSSILHVPQGKFYQTCFNTILFSTVSLLKSSPHSQCSEAESGQNPARRCSFVNNRPNSFTIGSPTVNVPQGKIISDMLRNDVSRQYRC